MPTQEEIYKTEGDKYEALIAREDYQGNIMRALREITSLENRVVYDLGAGTGRLACLLAPHVSKSALLIFLRKCCGCAVRNSSPADWSTGRWMLPIIVNYLWMIQSADLVVSGWSVAILQSGILIRGGVNWKNGWTK